MRHSSAIIKSKALLIISYARSQTQFIVATYTDFISNKFFVSFIHFKVITKLISNKVITKYKYRDNLIYGYNKCQTM